MRSQDASVPNSMLENIEKWVESGHAERWVDAHSGQWNHAKWLALLDELKTGPYWPMAPDDVGAHIESVGREYRQKHAGILGRVADASLLAALRRYVAGLAVVGLASGFFAGASHAPIVGTLLPLLFALVGGTSGIYVINADLSDTATAVRLRWLGRAIGVFGVACLIGSAAGISLRLHYEHPDGAGLLQLWHGGTQDGIELAALRKKLQMIGVSKDEQEKILESAA
jgi:hypothetical protein